MTPDVAERLRAEILGVEPSYADVDGVVHHTDHDTLRAVVDALASGPAPGAPALIHRGRPTDVVALDGTGPAQLRLADGTTVDLEPVTTGTGRIVALPPDVPVGFHQLVAGDGHAAIPVIATPETLGRRPSTGGIGLFAPTYTLWRHGAHDPSIGLLGELAARAATAGVDCIATLPLYATFIDDTVEPFDPSPYAPVSRLHWNDAYLDLPGADPAPAAPPERLVDWAAVNRRSRAALAAAVADLPPIARDRLDRFVAERPDVGGYARFRAAVERAGSARGHLDTGGLDAAVVDRHTLGQLLMHERLASLAAELRGRGQALALDLPIGSHADGWETFSDPGWYASSMSVGAPPDPLFRGGQNWGFPPLHPGAGRAGAHEPWRRVLTRATEHADLLRIDHVMGLHRLWWIPDGAEATAGVYVRYPADELMAVVATVAHTTGTTIVGENLGTVPREVGLLLSDWEALGMFEEGFVMVDEREDPGLPSVPADTVAGFRTHDMPSFVASYRGADLSRPAPPSDLELRLARRRRAVERYRNALAAEIGRPVTDAAPDVLAAALERLGRSDAHLVMVDLDDLLGETEPHNVPGVADPIAWRRRLSVDLDTATGAESTRSLLGVLGDARRERGHRPRPEDPTDPADPADPADPIERI